ncbi:uncharacterized protein PGTG_06920 [Puccinia graminis f. sp. tritici CRL 75-36-700-3]|uniref:Uncharacterized protein n=1 Tax=Puccinia graminis f. sp. tritici (strain CRL 75-36-700-3 / race SCCL) TaxID=418459 RepID=E3KAE2_PUCGT|nr:uncharacterized protein PGTG_06920 [Puccinia graminis f. sp. tritici CRL 75-36-700-3]EFP81299.2 hypothetical protein PGTG_06920 [Puccinia graminis f. sp. tritici CRL 75-36-700-3]
MSSNSHSNHPLYAFLQSDPSRHQADPEISAARVQGTSPAEDADSEKIGADRGLNKHLISLLTTVQAHSSQLDQMVKHLNSLVRRVESVESIFSDGQEQIHQSVAEFRSDTEKIANRQLEAVCSQVEQQNNSKDNQGLLLAKLEKDVHYLTIQANGLEPRLVAEKNEYLQRMSAIQKEFDTLNSSLGPISLMAPLLQAFLESQLRSSSRSKEQFEKSFACHHNSHNGQGEISEKTVIRHSSAINMGRWREGNSTETSSKRPERHKTKRPDSSGVLGNVSEPRLLDDAKKNEVKQPMYIGPEDTQMSRNQETEEVSSKVEAEHEPTTTQASESHSKDEVQTRADEPIELPRGRAPSSHLAARRSMSRRKSQAVRPNSTQQDPGSIDHALDLQRAHSKKRARSRTPTGLDREHTVHTKLISSTQLRRISSQQTTHNPASCTILSEDCHHQQSNQVIGQAQINSVVHKVRTLPSSKNQEFIHLAQV